MEFDTSKDDESAAIVPYCPEMIQAKSAAESKEDNFKPVFKFFKRKFPQPDLGPDRLVDPLNPICQSSKLERIQPPPPPPPPSGSPGLTSDLLKSLDLRCPSQWLIHKFKTTSGNDVTNSEDSSDVTSFVAGEGIILVSNPFTSQGHIKWGLRCLKDYSRSPPNKTNLDSCIPPVTSPAKGDSSDAKRRRMSSNICCWWDTVYSCKSPVENEKECLDKLRWATLGFHHNWDTKKYSLKSVSEFPSDLALLSKTLAQVLLPEVKDYKAEASIVNFYPENTTLSGHTDHSEPNRKAPLVSISFGRPAVFLIGGPTKETTPEAVLLRSGDVLVMTEKARNSFHGVPRIIDQQLVAKNSASKCHGVLERLDLPKLPQDLQLSSEQKFCQKYLSNHRININIRKVF